MRYQFDGANWELCLHHHWQRDSISHCGFQRTFAGDLCHDQCATFNQLLAMVDNNGLATITSIATAGVNQKLARCSFCPNAVAAPPVITLTRNGSNIVLSWPAPYSLQCSTDVAGTFTNVVGATSPY